MSRNGWMGVIIVLIILIGGYYLWQSSQNSTVAIAPTTDTQVNSNPSGADYTPPTDTTDTSASSTTTTNTNSGVDSTQTATITYDGKKFTPTSVTIKKGGVVNFKSTAGDMWVASDPHPTHTGYSGTSRTAHCPDTAGTAFDQCAPGKTYSFIFLKAGAWSYHNHLDAEIKGLVNVI